MFIVFSLPRSRSTWLSVFLGRTAPVGHDIYIGCAHPDEFASKLEALAGTCETGAGFAAPLIRKRFPNCKFVVILRDPAEVAQSLERFGITGQLAELQRRYADLLEIAKDPETLTLNFSDLTQLEACRLVYERCLAKPLDGAWWAQLANLNVQVDMALEFARIQASATHRDQLKREVQRQLAKPGLMIEQESWSLNLWEEAEPLAKVHFAEVDGCLTPARTFGPDLAVLAQQAASGQMRIFTARIDGALVGYLTWHISRDVEAAGGLIATQGAWYVAQGHPRAAHCLFRRSLEDLSALGIGHAFAHAPATGRGASLGRFFAKQGGAPLQTVYSLRIGD